MSLACVSGGLDSSRVILALDVPDIGRARELAMAVREAVGMVKVGLELFVQSGREAVEVGRVCDRPIFLDLKLHDIPETVDRAVARASALGAKWITVHASGGATMLERAVARARHEATGLDIVAVTVLTSLDDSDLAALGFSNNVESSVERLARLAWSCGVRIFVCSPREAARLRHILGNDASLVTPGVRPAGCGPGDDQKRTLSAGEAVDRGADWVVVGRPIRDAADPLASALRLKAEVQEALARRNARYA